LEYCISLKSSTYSWTSRELDSTNVESTLLWTQILDFIAEHHTCQTHATLDCQLLNWM
jgi:hypothetical protein